MKKVKHLIVAILFLTTYMPFATAQKQAWHWYFGYNAGIDFSSGAPGVVTNGAINCLEGVASMSDSLGNLLFYTDGRNVYDATHNNMPNGFNLLGHTSSTQSAVIVKKPGANNLYYIFTMDYNHDGLSAGDGFNYSIVDMNLNGSLGDVVTANMPIRANVFEKICATKHGNNMDYWIMINDWIDDDIYAYLLDSTGLNLTPVISNAGPFHGQDIGQSAGYFKANRQGNKLALALWAKNSFDILDFNNQTGIASNHIILQAPDMEYTYGAEFSPSGKYLYGTRMNPPSKLFQFDLSAGSQVAILNSRTTLDSNLNSYYYSALQIAPDFKIYAAHRDNNTLGVIDQPDSAALNCSYIDNAVYFSGNICASGLPNFVPDYVFPITATIPTANLQSSDTIFCEKQSINFFDLSTNNPTSWQWYFTGAQPNSSTLQNPNGIYYPNYGQFDVSLKVCNVGGCDSLFFPNFIAELQSPPAPIVTVNGSIMCSSPAYSYAWYETSSLSTILSTTQCFQPLIPGDYFVIIADSNGCSTPSATVIITSIKEHETNPCKLWLSGTKLNLQSNCITDPESFLQVYDAQGKEVFKSQLSSSSVDLPLTNSGIYFYRLVSRGLESQGKFSFLK